LVRYSWTTFVATTDPRRSLLAGGRRIAAAAQLLIQAFRFLEMIRSEEFRTTSIRQTALRTAAMLFLARGALLIAGGIVIPLLFRTPFASRPPCASRLAPSWLGRYLFFCQRGSEEYGSLFMWRTPHDAERFSARHPPEQYA